VPAGVLLLRRQHRLVGAMVGGIAEYKSQVSVQGLPLQLSREETALALGEGGGGGGDAPYKWAP